MELPMIYKISPSPLCQRGGKKGKTFLKKERKKAEMTHSVTRRAVKLFTQTHKAGRMGRVTAQWTNRSGSLRI